MATYSSIVGQSNHDNREETNGNANHVSETIITLDANCIIAEFIFTGAGAAVGQTITPGTAFVSFYGDGASLNTDFEIYIEATDTAAVLTAGANDISARVKSTAHVTFNTTLSTSAYTASADISSVLQEYFNRAGATGTFGIIIVRTSQTTGIETWDGDTSKAVKITFDYGAVATVRKYNLASLGVGN